MKSIVYILVFLTATARCQNKLNTDQINILNIELTHIKDNHPNSNSLKKIIGDSLLVNKKVNRYDPLPPGYDLKKLCMSNEELTVDEANEIFGNGEFSYPDPDKHKTHWSAEDFAGYKIAFFEDRKKSPRDNVLATLHNVISISIPSIRSDGKFALMHVEDSAGGQLKIYKKVVGKWVSYKSIWLYLV